jgi:hypothetical protein
VTTNAKGLTTTQSAIAITAGTGNAPAIVVIGSTTGTVAFNCGSATAGTITVFQAAAQAPIQLSGNLTVTNSGCTPGQELVFLFQQAAAGGPFTVTFPAGWVTNDGPCQIHQAASVITKATFYFDGTQGRLKSCVSTGAFSMGTENADPATNPPSGFEYAGFSTSRKTGIWRDNAGNFKIAPRTACLTDQLCAQDTTSVEYCTGGGTANAQTVACTPANQTLVNMTVRWKPSVANTAATTLGVDGLTVKNLTKCGTTALASGDLTTAAVATATYDGTQFQLLNPQAATCGAAAGSLTPTSVTPKWLWGVGYSDGTNAGGTLVAASANNGKTIALTVDGVLQFGKICYHVLAAAGAKGLGIEITNLAATSVRVLMTAAVISAGASFGCLSVGSGADTSAGVATLPAGGYLLSLTSDDTTLALDGYFDGSGTFCQILNQNTANATPPTVASYCSTTTTAMSTGTGSGLAFNALSGLTFTVNTQGRFIPILAIE